MAGRFEGLTDEQWVLLEPLFPAMPEKRGRGKPPANRRKVLNSILYILITGSRWCDLPQDPEVFAARSTSHRWMQIWAQDGVLAHVFSGILSLAQLAGQIDWEAASVDGAFSPWEGRR